MLTLLPREEMVLSLRHQGFTLKDIAKRLNISSERVRQIEARGIRKREFFSLGVDAFYSRTRTIALRVILDHCRHFSVKEKKIVFHGSLADLATCTDAEWMRMRGVGPKVLSEIRWLLGKLTEEELKKLDALFYWFSAPIWG